MINKSKGPWRASDGNTTTSGVPARTKQASGESMSHHEACEASAREPHENLECSYYYLCTSSNFAKPPGEKKLHALLSLVALLVTWTSLLGAALAQDTGDQRRSAFDDPVWKGPSLLVFDTRPPPAVPLMHLQRRQDEEEATPTKSAATSTASLDTDPEATPTNLPIPKPFDTALSNNFTANCAAFFRTFLSDEAFGQCHPFSLMLQTSSAMFDASKAHVRITRTLEATCGASMPTCAGTMSHLARELVADNNCAVDYGNDNPVVLQAYNGLLAYEPMYLASCLRDDEGSYCYANAVTNRSAPTDSYPYYLPLGVPLPGGARATCNSCLQDAMAIFSSFAGNTTQPISKTYNGAAQQIGIVCGTNFINQTAMPMKGTASATSVSFAPTLTLLMFILYFFQ